MLLPVPEQGAMTAASARGMSKSFQPAHSILSFGSSSGMSQQAAAPATAYFVYVWSWLCKSHSIYFRA